MSWQPQLPPPISQKLVTEMTVDGVRNDHRFIFTDLRVRDRIEARHGEMMAYLERLAVVRETRD